MVQYWAMAPAEYGPSGEKAATYRKCWDYDLRNNTIAMGWDLGEKPRSREHLDHLFDNYADPNWEASPTHILRMLSMFWFDIEPGDIVIARAGVLRYAGIGEFQGDAYYDPTASCSTWGCSLRKVNWEPHAAIRRSPIRFTRSTLSRLSPQQGILFVPS